MWAAILNDENEFQNLIQSLSKNLSLDFEKTQTATGAVIAECSAQPLLPCFGFAPDSQEHANHLLVWLHQNRHPEIFVSTGVVRSCGPAFVDSPYLVPDLCVRTAGRVDFGGVPILYEEFAFDAVTQAQIKSLVALPRDSVQKIFGPPRDISLPENREFIFKNFGAVGTDPHIGHFVRCVKSLGSVSGSLEVFAEASHPLALLSEAWEKIFRKLMSV